MMNQKSTRQTVLTLLVAAGTAAASGLAVSIFDAEAKAQTRQQDRPQQPDRQQQERDRQMQERDRNPDQRAQDVQQVRNLTFIRSSDLLGADLRNDVDDDLGSIEEIIVNRGTGRIEHVIIREGGFLGMGGSHVAIPYEALVINPAEKSVALNVAADAIKGDKDRPLPSGWTRLESGWEDRLNTLESAKTARQQSWHRNDGARAPQDRRAERGEETEVNGRITALDRKEINGQEWAVATIETRGGESGDKQKVVLGPAWHVFGHESAPIRGDTFEGKVRKDGEYWIVDRANVNNREFRFENDRGEPAWGGERRTGASGDDRNPGALVLLSEVNSRDAKTRESNWGQIEGSIIELSSGTVAFLLLDPDENFLGIGDEMRVVPWSIVSIGSESVVIDATKPMLTSAKTLPEDMRVFTLPDNLRNVYMSYNVEQPEFRRRR